MPAKHRQIFLILAVWIGILSGMTILGGTPVTTGSYLDSDDYMRMVRVFDILDNAGSPSYFEPRLGVNGSEMGWSRLVDWPLVAIQGTLEIFMPRMEAAMWTATIMPGIMLLALLLAACFYMRPILGTPVTFFMLLAVFAQWAILRQFIPGRVDHHMWQILLCILGYGGLVRLYVCPHHIKTAILTGMAFGFGLAIGADIVPWLAAGGALLSWFWFISGKDYERALCFFGISVGATTTALYLLLTPFARLTYIACDALSPFWTSLALAVTVFGAIIVALPANFKDTRIKRLLCGGITAAMIGGTLFKLFPSCILDPYMIEDEVIRDMWLHNVGEAKSVFRLWDQNAGLAKLFMIPCIMGLIAVGTAAIKDKNNRILWGGLSIVLGIGALLSLYQVRTMDFAQAISILPLAWLFTALANGISKKAAALSKQQRLAFSSIFFVIMLIAAIIAGQHRQEIREETDDGTPNCRRSYITDILSQQPAPQMIAAHIDLGGQILFRTRHKVLAAPYHRNEDGMRAAYDIFTAATADDAMKKIAEVSADILVYCENPHNFWATVAPTDNAFIDQLIAGNIPHWLTPLGDPQEGYKIYKVEYRP